MLLAALVGSAALATPTPRRVSSYFHHHERCQTRVVRHFVSRLRLRLLSEACGGVDRRPCQHGPVRQVERRVRDGGQERTPNAGCVGR